MTEQLKRIYWDTTCWLCLINQKERARRTICVDILTHAKNGKILLYTSTLSIAEVIRPKINGVKLPKLTAEQIAKITAFFKHKYIRKITLDERIATKAVELARDYNLAPADAIHAASAITKAVDELQAWDRDFNSIISLVDVKEPTKITPQTDIEDFLTDEDQP